VGRLDRITLLGCLLGAALSVLAGMAPAATAAAVARRTQDRGDSSARCRQCHMIARDFSHPVGIAPSMAVPADLPTPGGRVECITCHEPMPASDPTATDPAATAPHGRPRDAALCHRCHDARFARDGHSALHVGRAHLLWPGERSFGHDDPGALGGFDQETTTCLGCHDGTVAAVGFGTPGGGGQYHGRGSHPVAVPYRRVERGRPAYDGLRHPTQLDPRVRLFDDRIGCGSCHSPYADRDDLLVMTNDRSTLCLACHDY